MEIQPAGAGLTRIVELHVVECIEELSVEREPGLLGDFSRLGDGKVQIPAMLAVQRAEIVGPAVLAQNYRPEHVVHRLGVGELIDASSTVTRIAVAADAASGHDTKVSSAADAAQV